MQKTSSHKTKHFFALVIKLFIVIGFGYFIYLKLAENEQLTFSVFYTNLIKNNVFSLKNVLLLLLFTFFNWFFEIYKWHLLVSQIQKISFYEAAIQSLASLTASLITPNRIGEYGAKALYFKKSFGKKIVTLNLIGNLSQLFTTIFFGIIGCLYLFFNFNIEFDFTNIIFFVLFFILLFIIIWFIDKKGLTVKGYSIQSFKNFIIGFQKKNTSKSCVIFCTSISYFFASILFFIVDFYC